MRGSAVPRGSHGQPDDRSSAKGSDSAELGSVSHKPSYAAGPDPATVKRADDPWLSADAQRPSPDGPPVRPIHGYPIFSKLLEKERARADRSGRPFSLAFIGVNGDEGANGGGSAGTGAGRSPFDLLSPHMLRLATLVSRRARETDEVGFCHAALLAVLLTDTPAEGGQRFLQEITLAMGAEARDVVGSVYSYPSTGTPTASWSPVIDQLRLTATQAGNGNGRANGGNGHGNGHRNGNGSGNGHRDGNGNGNGNGHPAVGSTVAGPPAHVDSTRLEARESAANDVTSAQPRVDPAGIGLSPVNGPLQLLFARPVPYWKRAIDIVGAATGLILLAPVMLLVAVGVRLTSRGPVIFGQVRAGQGGRPFVLYKFRSMRVDAEAEQGRLRAHSEQDGPAFKMSHDPRVTPFGRFIRKSSLDELPQLWNVLKGDMSLVGPRPLPWTEACACEPWQRRRLDVMPGITCIWQVEGRSRVSFARWMRMDIAYIRGRSLRRDVRLLLKTIPAVILRRGAN